MSGELRTRDAAALWRALKDAARDVPSGATIELDMSEVSAIDGNVVALLIALRAAIAAKGARAVVTNMRGPVARIAELYAIETPLVPATRRRPESAVEQVGATTLSYVEHLEEMLAFLGGLVLAAAGRRGRPRAARWREVASLVESIGADGMAIVFAILFVVGFIFAYSTADQFIRIGQRLLSADLIGRGMVREVAPVMTAVILAGRSGAAFAAEIGSMKIDHEIDALRTLGLEPFAWLVVPRTIAFVVALPALVMIGNFFGFAGGALVGVTTLGLKLAVYVHALRDAVSSWDIASGMIKSAAFGLTIALIACQQGFAASGGPEDVGRRTTQTVVASLFFTVVNDAILTIIYRSFGG